MRITKEDTKRWALGHAWADACVAQARAELAAEPTVYYYAVQLATNDCERKPCGHKHKTYEEAARCLSHLRSNDWIIRTDWYRSTVRRSDDPKSSY